MRNLKRIKKLNEQLRIVNSNLEKRLNDVENELWKINNKPEYVMGDKLYNSVCTKHMLNSIPYAYGGIARYYSYAFVNKRTGLTTTIDGVLTEESIMCLK